ncbi:mannitol dehydrogenase family protein [Aquidulcibacter sp.]|uniref:mannitol dehydrogenase family protein n=1 Tax=Aquidulcibacter sp. TaxID=2052990 RepID=UPI0025C134FA|nr:mannitol dehydrogenase family protein [Aquidulcibacter sp.]MCA3697424.1 mannitol dehydrogenase family protein [Aquidulcibacter sp.]
MKRLSDNQLPKGAEAPAYDRRAVRVGQVHLGVGAFHRAHQAVYTEACLAAGDLSWGILGASLRSPQVADQLNPQQGLYSCLVREGAESRASVIGAIQNVLVAPENPAALVEAMADKDVHVVTLTITEKGYHLDPATGALRMDDPAIAADLATPHAPATAPGLLVAALAARKARGLTPFTALSCDNLPDNGGRLKQAVLDFARVRDPALADWIERFGAFPASMVDRIVPATTSDDLAQFAADFGAQDFGLVKTEPFSQWVIEDHFAGERPQWELAGAQFTQDVAPWEMAKLRLLNGAHSALAYLGNLAGYQTVDQAMGNPAFERFVDHLQDEAESTLTPPPGLNLATYRADLKRRFKNAALMHKTYQIAMDGSQKLPQRLLATIETRMSRGQDFACLALAVAGWMRWQAGFDEQGQPFEVQDPLAAKTRALYHKGQNGFEKAASLCSLEAVFGPKLPSDPRFADAVGAALDALLKHGARATVEALVQKEAAR